MRPRLLESGVAFAGRSKAHSCLHRQAQGMACALTFAWGDMLIPYTTDAPRAAVKLRQRLHYGHLPHPVAVMDMNGGWRRRQS